MEVEQIINSSQSRFKPAEDFWKENLFQCLAIYETSSIYIFHLKSRPEKKQFGMNENEKFPHIVSILYFVN